MGAGEGDPRSRRPPSPRPPPWLIEVALLERAYAVAVTAHGSQRRATDQRLFLEHVIEVATLLYDAGLDEELTAVGLLHDAVERGTATEAGIRIEMGDGICSLVMALTEDRSLESFAARKEALRDQVRLQAREQSPSSRRTSSQTSAVCNGGSTPRRESIKARMGTTIAAMAGHYRESVHMIEASDPSSCFIPLLHQQRRSLTTPPT